MTLTRGVVVLAVAGSCAASAPAQAGTASVSSNSVTYLAAAGEANRTSFSVGDRRGSSVTVADSTGVVPGPGCTAVEPTRVLCTPELSSGSVARLQAALGDGDDRLAVDGPLGIEADGGAGGDLLTGSGADDDLRGGPGRDTLSGGGGDDTLLAGTGGGHLRGGRGEDRLEGGAGADTLEGGPATDRVSGAGGADVIRARDGTPDEVYCGIGPDRAALDDSDFASSACERRTRGRTGAATIIEPDYRFFSPAFAEGGTNLLIGCPGDAPGRCKGTVVVRRGRTVLGRGPFSVRRDRVGQAREVKPTRAGARLKTGKPVRATVILVTRGRGGRPVVRRRAGSAEDFPSSEFE